jgi:hypothetical protein
MCLLTVAIAQPVGVSCAWLRKTQRSGSRRHLRVRSRGKEAHGVRLSSRRKVCSKFPEIASHVRRFESSMPLWEPTISHESCVIAEIKGAVSASRACCAMTFATFSFLVSPQSVTELFL